MASLFPMYAFSAPSGELPLYTDVAMDFEAGTPRWESGNPVLVTGLEAVKSWAWRAIATARYRWPIFDWSYGCELEALVGQPYQADTKRSEAERYVEEALTVCPYIRAVHVREVRLEGATLHLSVDLDTVYGGETIHV